MLFSPPKVPNRQGPLRLQPHHRRRCRLRLVRSRYSDRHRAILQIHLCWRHRHRRHHHQHLHHRVHHFRLDVESLLHLHLWRGYCDNTSMTIPVSLSLCPMMYLVPGAWRIEKFEQPRLGGEKERSGICSRNMWMTQKVQPFSSRLDSNLKSSLLFLLPLNAT